jgi:peroxiredoxin
MKAGVFMAIQSTMLELGTKAPDFALPDVVSGQIISRSLFDGDKALLVMFICRHCPYVKHVQDELARLGKDYQRKGVGIVAIGSNDAVAYPDDRPESLKEMAASVGFTFPFLYDETQDVARHTWRRARRTSFSSINSSVSCTAGNWTTAGRTAGSPSPVATCAPRSTPCSPAATSVPTSGRASGVGSNGRRVRRRTDELLMGSTADDLTEQVEIAEVRRQREVKPPSVGTSSRNGRPGGAPRCGDQFRVRGLASFASRIDDVGIYCGPGRGRESCRRNRR